MKTQTLFLGALLVAVLSGCVETKIAADRKSVPERATAPERKVIVTSECNAADGGTARFQFKTVPAPSRGDAATLARSTVVDGTRDANGGNLIKLHDGKVPTEGDQPAENFFFGQNTDGGRLLVDLTNAIEIKQVNTYSWHPGTRGPQVYKLFASDGTADGFKAEPKKDTDPEKAGWKFIAKIDTRPKDGGGAGQHGVSISDSTGSIGKYRYLLFDIARTESDDPFGNTFFSEIDVIDRDAGPEIAVVSEEAKPITKS